MTLWRELKRRKVVRTTIAYLAGSFVAAQATQLLVDGFGLPGWILRALLIALLVGLPLAVGLAWAFDVTPTGIERAGKTSADSVVAVRWPRIAIPVLASALVLFASLAFLSADDSEGSAADGHAEGLDPRHIAVLYFRPLGGDSLAPLADGLTEGLIRELARGTTLRVISPNGVLPYRTAPAMPDSIGRALQVGTLVDGSVAAVGDSLRLNVSLVSASNAEVMATASFALASTALLSLQDSLLGTVALFLRQHLGEELALNQDRQRTRSPEAWRLYLEARTMERGVKTLIKAGDTAAARRELLRADTLLQRATSLDADWTAPLVERGRLAYLALDLIGTFDGRHYDEWTRRGLEQLAVALSRRSDDADALALRGTLRYWRNILNLGGSPQAIVAQGDSAEADFRAAVALDPQHADAWSILSHRLMRTNRTAEAKLAAMRAYESDPYAPSIASVLVRLYAASLDLEDREEATRWCAEGVRRFPDNPLILECRISVQTLAGQQPNVPEMWRLLEEQVNLWPPAEREFRRRRGQLFVAMTLVRAGLPDSARAVANRARADAQVDPSRDLVYIEIFLRNMLGDRGEALALAAQYYAANPQERIDCSRDSESKIDRTWWTRGLVDDERYLSIVCTRR